MRSATWYARLADVPGLDFAGSPDVNRARLPGHDTRPEVVTFALDGTVRESLHWPQAAWTTSWPPAQEHAAGVDRSTLDLASQIQVTWEAVELAGETFTYHFILQSTVVSLWADHRRDAAALAALEAFARLDIGLLAAQRRSFLIDEMRSETQYVHVATFVPLLTMLEHEGAWREALEIAEQAVLVGQQAARRDRLAERVVALDAERQ